MIGLKDAIKVAKDFIQEVYEKEEDLLLEAASLNQGEKNWYVSFSFPKKFAYVTKLQATLGLDRHVVYKTVKIDENGEVIGMEMGVPNYETEIKETETKQLEAA